ncbi:MAG: dihydrolipoyl dehydrogenase [Desulfobacteraceae bacterium]
MQDKKTELAVIGGGPGGYAAAFLAADLGISVTLIDPAANPGGVCLYRGCIPSKALLHVAKLIQEAREAQAWGVDFGAPKIDAARLSAWKEKVVGQLTGGLGQLVKQRKVNHIQGTAAFRDAGTLKVTDSLGATTTLSFEKAIVAVGSRAMRIPGFDKGSDKIWFSRQALELSEIPKRLLVIGGGYIGLELGTVYAALGSEVTVAEMMPALLPGVDKELVRYLKKQLSENFKEILLETMATDPRIQKNGVKVTLKDKKGESATRLFDKVLVAVGRRPNTDAIGLEHTKVRLDQNGFIAVDERRQTAEPGIYAIGDAAGEPMLAHKASHEARIAVEVIAGRNVVYEPAAIPAVVFTDPEIAWAGLTETDAKENGIDYKVTRFPWSASGRAITLGRGQGVTKLVIETATERVLGVGIAGPGAGEMIAEGVMAIEMAATATDLSLAIHPHPTLSETLKEAAEVFHGTATHIYRPKKVI